MKVIYTSGIRLGILFLVSAFCITTQQTSAQCNYFTKVVTGASANHTLGIKSDGTLWAWGSNQFGQLGNGLLVNSPEPVQVSNKKDWKEITTGAGHSLAIDNSGRLWGWGSDAEGQLGDGKPMGNPLNILTPEHITSLDSTWKTVSASSKHSAGITTDGKLWVWGYSTFLENGTTTPNQPVQVGTDTDWEAISIGGNHFVAIKKDSTLWAWGINSHGEAGDSTTANSDYTPPAQIDSSHSWVYVSAGYNQTLALKKDSTLWAWGQNDEGQLGDGTIINGTHGPKQIGTNKWISAAAGYDHSLAIDAKGMRWAWGNNSFGQFGNDSNGNTTMNYVPELVDSSKNWTSVYAGFGFSLNLASDKTAWSSGDNDYQELGDGTYIRRYTLIKVGTPAIYPTLANSGSSDIEYQRGFTFYTTNCSNLISEVLKTGINPIHNTTTAKVWIDATVMSDALDKPYVQRHYEIYPAGNGTTASGTIILYFTQDEFTAYNSYVINGTYPLLPVDANDAQDYRDNLRINKIIGISSNGSGDLNTYKGTSVLIKPTSVTYVDGRWQATFDVKGFGGFFATTGTSVLPVTWLNVNGIINSNNQPQITWKVNEINTATYIVERSNNGEGFHSVASVNAKGSGINTYQYIDNGRLAGSMYYRIKQTDKDGRYNYSSIVSLTNNQHIAVSLFPNPANENVFINGLANNTNYTVSVVDMSGKTIINGHITSAQNKIVTSNLIKGIYVVKINADGYLTTLKLVKE